MLGAILLSCLFQGGACGDYSDELPGGYVFVSESPDIQEISRVEGIAPSEHYIPCNVVSYDYNKDFIVAKQIARVGCFHLLHTDGDPSGPRQNFLNQRDGETYYWIIEVDKRTIDGPYRLDQFESTNL